MPAATGFTLITASNIYGSLVGQKLATGQIQFTAVSTSTGSPISFEVGGSGQMVSKPFSFPIVAGVITADSSGIAPQLPDVSLTNPINIGYAVSIIDPLTGQNILGPGYTIQPTGATWSFDAYTPSLGTMATIQVGPAGPTGATGAAGTNGSNGAASVNQIAPLIAGQLTAVRNLFDASQYQNGGAPFVWQAVITSGLGVGFGVSGLIVVPPGGQVTTSSFTATNVGGASGIVFYDITGAPLAGTSIGGNFNGAGGETLGGSYTVPSNAAYMRLGMESIPGGFMVVAGTILPSSYIAFGQVDPATLAASIATVSAGVQSAATGAAAIPLAYATPGSTTATSGQTGVSGAVAVGGQTNVMPDVIPVGSYIESITAHLNGTTNATIVIGTFDGAPAPHNTFTVSNRMILSLASAVQLSPGYYTWRVGDNFPLMAAAPNTHVGIVSQTSADPSVQAYIKNSTATSTPYYEVDGDIGAGSATVYGSQVRSSGVIDLEVISRAIVPTPTTAQMDAAIAASVSSTLGIIRETRPLLVQAHKADGATTIFTATGPGNVERIQLAMIFNNGSPSTAPWGSETLINITVDGGTTQTAPLSLFMLWYGYTTADGASPAGDLFLTKYLGITNGSSGGGAEQGGYRRIYIKYNTSCVITLTFPGGWTGAMYSQVEYYAGVAPAGRYPATRNVFHMAPVPVASIAANGTLTLLGSTSGAGEVESLYMATASGDANTGWLEIPPALVLDGTTFTYGGMEDFFGNQFYGDALHGRTDEYGIARFFSAGAPDGLTYWCGYRYFCESPMIFNTSIAATWQNANSGSHPATLAGSLIVYYTAS